MIQESNDDIIKVSKRKDKKKREKKYKDKDEGKKNKDEGNDKDKDKDKEQNDSIKEKKTKFGITWEIQREAICKSVKQNYIFYIALIACLYAFSKSDNSKYSFIIALVTIIFITFYGYLMHFISHSMNTTFSRIYSQYDNFFTRNKYANWFASNFIYFMEFHATTHHDTSVNKQFKNVVLEIMNNLATQGVILIIVKYFLNLLDNRVILLWAFFYATVHNMNYIIVKPSTHREHHLDDKTNYGIDIWDILIGSKYDWNNIETHNHTAINLIVITAVIMYIWKRFRL
jgi:hypothetical protein